MRQPNLKIRFITIIFILLTFSMILIGAIGLYIYQYSVVNNVLNKVTAVSGIWMKENHYIFKSYEVVNPLKELCREIGPECSDIFIYSDSNFISIKSSQSNKYKISLENNYLEKEAITIKDGVFLSILFLQPKAIVKIFPPVVMDGGYSLGVIVDVRSILSNSSRYFKIILFYSLLNGIIGTTIAFFRIDRIIFRPIDKLISIADDFTDSGDLSQFHKKSSHEFGKLNIALSDMIERISDDKVKLKQHIESLEIANQKLKDSQKQVVNAEKLAAVGHLSAGLAHEIGNPISIASGYIELLEDDELSAQTRNDYTKRALYELERVGKMIRQLLDFSRIRKQSEDNASIRQILVDISTLFNAGNYGVNVEIFCNYKDRCDVVNIGYDDLYQVIVNCVLNSVDSIKEHAADYVGKIQLQSDILEDNDEMLGRISIIDNGKGVKSEDIKSIFDPFFTTKDFGKGTGLGLSVSYSIIEANGGSIGIDSEYGKGTTVTIRVPLLNMDSEFSNE